MLSLTNSLSFVLGLITILQGIVCLDGVSPFQLSTLSSVTTSLPGRQAPGAPTAYCSQLRQFRRM